MSETPEKSEQKEYPKKPKLTKAERRAKQESERAAKAEKKTSSTTTAAPTSAPRMQFDDPKKVAKYDKKKQVSRAKVQKIIPLFSHLPQFERETSLSLQVGFLSQEIHPAVLRVGFKMAEGVFRGSNARCLAMLEALSKFIEDYEPPKDQAFSRDLPKKLSPQIRFLIDCRPQSMSMGNAISSLKLFISKLSPELSNEAAKAAVLAEIQRFTQVRIEFACKIIRDAGASRIDDDDVIAVYGHSKLVETVLLQALRIRKKFRVVVIDSRPRFEGKNLAKKLAEAGILCTYALVTSVSYVISEITKVFLGCFGMVSNGNCIASIGAALVAMHANRLSVPVIVLSETYKFHRGAQIDAISFNELADPDELILSGSKNGLSDWRDISALKLLNLTYDAIPMEFISCLITEIGEIPPTAVPAVFREYMK